MTNNREVALKTVTMPADTNPNGRVFGGWLVSQMDLAGYVCVQKVTNLRMATVAIDKMKFIHAVEVGEVISLYCEIVKVGRSSVSVSVEAYVLDKKKQSEYLVTQGVFTYVTLNSALRPAAHGLII